MYDVFKFAARQLEALHAFLAERLARASDLPDAADLLVEGTMAVAGVTTDFALQVERMAPFGAGNEEPVFALPRSRVVRADRVGKEGGTIRAFVEGEAGGRLKAICFRAKDGPLAQALLGSGGTPQHLCGRLRAERWNDDVSACLHVVDAAAMAASSAGR